MPAPESMYDDNPQGFWAFCNLTHWLVLGNLPQFQQDIVNKTKEYK